MWALFNQRVIAAYFSINGLSFVLNADDLSDDISFVWRLKTLGMFALHPFDRHSVSHSMSAAGCTFEMS